jgi:hypothetical protein
LLKQGVAYCAGRKEMAGKKSVGRRNDAHATLSSNTALSARSGELWTPFRQFRAHG